MAEPRPAKRLLRLLLIAVAIVALIVALLVLSVVRPSASAANDLRGALETTRDFKGWVHVATTPPELNVSPPQGVVVSTRPAAQPAGPIGHLNTVDGTYVRDSVINGHRRVEMHVPQRRTAYVYDAGAAEIRVSKTDEPYPPRFADEVAGAPVTLPDLLDRYTNPAKAPPSTDASRDGDLMRYDLVFRGERRAFKGSLWIDPATKLLRKSRWDTPDGPVDVTYSYGPPEITDIHDLGIPRDVKVLPAGPATR